jgi:DNA-binding FrmR family transcriptional regulator
MLNVGLNMCEQATHEHKSTTAVINSLSRAIGHLESVKKMIEDLNSAIKQFVK